MFAQLRQIAHGFQNAIGHVVGVTGQETNPPEAIDFVDGTQQVG